MKNLRFVIRINLALIAILGFATSSWAQQTTGLPPFGTFGGGPFDLIDVANLNTHFAIPVIHKAGRGLPFDYALTYDSLIWSNVGGVWTPDKSWGWQGITEAATGYVPAPTTTQLSCHVVGGGNETYIKHIYRGYVDAIKVWRPVMLTLIEGAQDCGPPSVDTATGTTTDGSGFTVQVDGSSTGVVTTRGGQVMVVPSGTDKGTAHVTDNNGNQLTTSNGYTFVDTQGSTVLNVTGGAPNPLVHTYTAPSGASAAVTVYYQTYTVQTTFCVSGITDYSPTSASLVDHITLADGTQYSFTYEPTPALLSGCTSQAPVSGAVTGRIARVTLPTGGYISYAYAGGSNGIFADGTTAAFYRTVNDGTNSRQWLYSRGNNQDTVTDPDGNQTVYSFSGIYETQRQVYQGSTSGTLLETILNCYNGNFTNCATATVTTPISQTNGYLTVGSRSSSVQSLYNSTYGFLTERDEWDFTTGSFPATANRKTAISYDTSLTNGILDHPSHVYIYDGSGGSYVLKAETDSYYDTENGNPTVTGTSGTPQHIAVSGSRGNLTEVDRLVSGSTFLKQYFTYFDTGTTNTVKDVNQAITTYNYGTNTTLNCGNSFPVSVSLPLGLSTSTTWNCTGAVASQTTDVNGKNTSIAWSDPYFWRPDHLTDPLSNVLQNTYVSPSELEQKLSFNGGASAVDTLSVLDGIGRPHISQERQTPGVQSSDSAEVDYDAEGRAFKQTMPYVGADAAVAPSTTPYSKTLYDSLNRPTYVYQVNADGSQVQLAQYTYNQNDALVELDGQPTGENPKKRQYEYDGLGRLTSVCEITSGTGSGSCGQSSPQTGYWTKYTYDVLNNLLSVVQNAQSGSQQTRTYAYDALSRMTSETNPESGTTQYSYDTMPSPCSGAGTAYPGDLTMTYDAAGHRNCYYTDSLHRVTDVGYSGPTCRRFRYDAQTVNGVAMVNSIGRLARAYTDNCGSTVLTDEGFSYDADGRVTDFYQSTPHSGGFYHLNGTYWPHGLLNTLSMPGISAFPTFTYGGLDGEGRPTTVTASSGQSPVIKSVTYENTDSGTSNEPVGSLLSLTLGSNDSDAFQYDKSTGRMTKYTFNVGAQSEVSNLTWNANGSLGSLSITDPFNPSDSQTCTYGHDDLHRVNSVNCGTAWNQTFSYDAFGNLTKNGSISFQPTYDTTTNHFSLTGVTVTYDGAGNLTNDSVHSYGWDSFGSPTTIDTVNLTYDAMGRMVEQASGSSYTQILYGPLGNKLGQMTGQTIKKLYIPMVGGTVAIYGSSGLLYYRHADWLGSTRLASTPTQTMQYDSAKAPFGESYGETGSGDRSFTGMKQDTVSGLYDFMLREFSSSQQGRWISPDPAGVVAVNITNPQSWNRYAYVDNNPLGSIDPAGLCDVFVGGITQTPGTAETQQEEQFAGIRGMELSFPFAGGGGIGGIVDVFEANMGGETQEVKSVVAAINAAAQSPGPINIFTFSGGASAFATARHHVSADVLSRINNVTFIEPGIVTGAPLPGGNGSTTVLLGTGFANNAILSASNYPLGATLVQTNCDHSSNCVLSNGALEAGLENLAGNPCKNPQTFLRGGNVAGGGGGGGGGRIGNGDGTVGHVPTAAYGGALPSWYTNMVLGTPVVTTRVILP